MLRVRTSCLVLLSSFCAAIAGSVASRAADDFLLGPYVSLQAGGTLPSPSEGNILTPRPPQPSAERSIAPAKFSSERGYNVAGAIGWKTGFAVRGEVEFGWRSAGVDRVNGVQWSGKQDIFGVMGNVLVDADMDSAITPYIGAGAGAARRRYNNVVAPGPASDSQPVLFSSHDTGFQWQLITGMSMPIGERVSMYFDYRYIRLKGHAVQSQVPVCTCTTIISNDAASHNFMLGIRISFGVPHSGITPVPIPPGIFGTPPPEGTPAPPSVRQL